MDTIFPLALGSIKALVLLIVASGAALALHRRSARVRAVVWSIALAGCVAIPLVAPLLPVWSFPIPEGVAQLTAPEEPALQPITVNLMTEIDDNSQVAIATPTLRITPSESRSPTIPWPILVLAIWAIGTMALSVRLATGLWRVSAAIRRAQPVTDPRWLGHLDRALEQLSCRRRIRLLVSREIEIPATVGVFRPAIMLPLHASTWLDDRRQAVLLHELVHVVRLDWPARLIARIARAAYWFNPLAWWAVRRLDLEQELACDEEVLALGTGASDYACHLLGIARHALPTPAPAIPALGMARMTHLEERIMTILKRSTHRRVGMAVIFPAAILMAAMVPALASVYPGDPTPRAASAELKEILAEMEAAEERMEPHLERIEMIEVDMEPQLEVLADIEITFDDSMLEDIEVRMEPYLEQLKKIEIDMEPFQDQIEEFEKQMEEMNFHIEDGNLEDVQQQIHEQMAVHMELIEQIHIQMEPFHEQMKQIHIELEPFHEEMEILGDRLEKSIEKEVESYLRSELGAVTSPGAPFAEAAARIADDTHINVNDGELKIRGDQEEIREILNDLLLPFQIGTQDSFDTAIDNAATGISPMVILVD